MRPHPDRGGTAGDDQPLDSTDAAHHAAPAEICGQLSWPDGHRDHVEPPVVAIAVPDRIDTALERDVGGIHGLARYERPHLTGRAIDKVRRGRRDRCCLDMHFPRRHAIVGDQLLIQRCEFNRPDHATYDGAADQHRGAAAADHVDLRGLANLGVRPRNPRHHIRFRRHRKIHRLSGLALPENPGMLRYWRGGVTRFPSAIDQNLSPTVAGVRRHAPLEYLGRGKWPDGKLRPNAPVEALYAQQIARRLRDSLQGENISAICRQAGLNRSTVQDILAGRTYGQVADHSGGRQCVEEQAENAEGSTRAARPRLTSFDDSGIGDYGSLTGE